MCAAGERPKGDLDWIVMKTLEKDRMRRYDTATALARIWIVSPSENRSAHAHPAPCIARKRMRRHFAAFAAVATVVVALMCGIIVSGWQMVRAKRAEQNAEQSPIFLTEMFRALGRRSAQGGHTALLRGVLDRTAERVGPGFKSNLKLKCGWRTTLRMLYYNIGEFAKAETMAYEAINISKRLRPGQGLLDAPVAQKSRLGLRWEGS